MNPEWTIEQQIVYSLANSKQLTQVGDVSRALRDPEYAKVLLGREEGISGECDHDPLSNPEIQVVFDNDETDGFH